MLDNKIYKDRMIAYFNSYYAEYENKSEWFVDPAPNQMKGYFPEEKTIVLFTCDDEGDVTVEKTPLTMNIDILQEVVSGCTRGMDAVYEDYLIYLVGEEGFYILRKNKLLESCGSINGRNLYTIACMKGEDK